MISQHVDHGTVRSAVWLATHAPSVHNSQPWKWYLGGRSIHLYADPSRWLVATDTDRRDLVLSCGAALHHLQIALAASGVTATVHRIPDPHQPDHLAALEFQPAHGPVRALKLAAAIPHRRTDRRPFGDWPLPQAFLDQLIAAAADQGAVLRAIDGAEARNTVMAAIEEATAIQEDDPAYLTELALWSGVHAEPDGIPPTNLLRQTPGNATYPARHFCDGTVGPGEPGTADGATLVVLGTASDDQLSQLRAGEALSAVLLRATDLGLGSCPLTQPLEVAAARRHVRDEVLAGTLSPQVIIRVGWAPKPALRATPRRPVSDVLAPLSH